MASLANWGGAARGRTRKDHVSLVIEPFAEKTPFGPMPAWADNSVHLLLTLYTRILYLGYMDWPDVRSDAPFQQEGT